MLAVVGNARGEMLVQTLPWAWGISWKVERDPGCATSKHLGDILYPVVKGNLKCCSFGDSSTVEGQAVAKAVLAPSRFALNA